MNNGNETKSPGLIAEITRMFADQADLASLELHYESAQAAKRLAALFVAALFTLAGFAIVQAVLVQLLVATGLSGLVASVVLVVIDFVVAGLIFQYGGRRNPKAGSPFAGTRREAQETLAWIQKIFS